MTRTACASASILGLVTYGGCFTSDSWARLSSSAPACGPTQRQPLFLFFGDPGFSFISSVSSLWHRIRSISRERSWRQPLRNGRRIRGHYRRRGHAPAKRSPARTCAFLEALRVVVARAVHPRADRPCREFGSRPGLQQRSGSVRVARIRNRTAQRSPACGRVSAGPCPRLPW